MSDLVFCRSCHIDLIFKDRRSVKVKDHCQLSLGIKGPVDHESGMIINLVEVNALLRKFTKKFRNRQVENLFPFIQVVRNYFRDELNKKFSNSLEIDFLSLTSYLGTIEWRSPWQEYDILFVKTQKRLLKMKKNRYEVKNVQILQRGLKINPHKDNLKNISGYGVYDTELEIWKVYELSRQEFGVKTFGK